jgi:GDPmannose 4,6-dehydratase
MAKRALICGISGQDGAYLAKHLLDKGYEVYGTSRDAQVSRFDGLQRVGVLGRVQLCSMALTDFRSVLQTLKKVEPDEIYNLAGQSSVGLSFEQPVETTDSIVGGNLNLLEAIRFLKLPSRFYNAGSSECYGNAPDNGANEATPFSPRSPYAAAKAMAYWQVTVYREAYGLFACTGVLFNHESPLRPERFVTKKIVAAACRCAMGAREKLVLGDLTIQRDWGWAPEYVDAIWRMLQLDKPTDLVIGTGRTTSLQDFVRLTFEAAGLDWQDYVSIDERLFRPLDIAVSRADPKKARSILGWQATFQVNDVVNEMVREMRLQLATKA